MTTRIRTSFSARLLFIAAVTSLFLLTPLAQGADKSDGPDWPFWRGPDHNGISHEKGWNPEALKNGPKFVWEKNVGQGWSAVAIQGPYLYTMGSTGSEDVVYCMKVDTGDVVWKHSYPCPAGNYPGPRSTPVWDEGRVYTVSREGQVHCLDAKKGRVLWQRNVLKAHRAQNIKWGIACAVRIEGKILLINVGERGCALDKKTGKTYWSSSGRGGYAVPVVFKWGRRKCVAMFSEKAIIAVDFRSGKKLWSYEWITSYDVNAADPVVVDGKRMFSSSGYRKGCVYLDFSRGRVSPVWQNAEIASHFGTSLLIDGHIYGPHGNTGSRSGGVKCLDLKDGSVKWSQQFGFCSLIAVDGKLIIINEQGQLVIAKADSKEYHEYSRFRVFQSRAKCWTAPVFL